MRESDCEVDNRRFGATGEGGHFDLRDTENASDLYFKMGAVFLIKVQPGRGFSDTSEEVKALV